MKNRTEKTVTSPKVWRRALLLIAAVLTAFAVAVTCALCIVDTESPIVDNVDVGTVGEVETSATGVSYTYNYSSGSTLIKNGDVKTFSAGYGYSVTLPRGQYKLEAWGARGGQYSGAPGYGGYTYGTYTITATTTIYIYVGGVGTAGNSTNNSKAGGFNGGGNGMHYGSGGGGATHFGRAVGLLREISAANVLIVAGGGGGSQSRAGGNGGGGTKNGVKCPSTSYGSGGCGGGTGGPHGDCNSSHTSSTNAGGFGYGGNGANGGDNNGGGGGGGGYYGGCGCTSDGSVVDDKGGGGGSGYVNTSYVTGGGGTTGAQNGAGSAKITAINVNSPPTTRSYTYPTTYARGARSITIYSYNIGQDPDYTNVSGANANSVYFSNGTASNYDTMPSANNGLFLDAACTKSASTYLSWSWSGTQTLIINNILRYPRNGVDNCTANGRLILYTRIRDGYSSVTARGVSVLSFTLNVSDNAIATNVGTVRTVSKTGYTYRIGNSTSTSTAIDYVNQAGQIYNTATNKKTVFLPKPISPTDKTAYTIFASDIYTDADTAHDKVAFKKVEPTSSAYYTITYNSDSTYASGLYPSITVKATGSRPPSATFVVATITAQSSETASKAQLGNENTEVSLVFKISNTRPYFASTAAMPSGVTRTEPVIEIAPGATYDLSLNSFLYDLDDGNTITSTFVQSADGLKVPTGEYVQVDMSNNVIALKNSSNYYNKGTVRTTGTLTSTSGEGNEETGFRSDVIAPVGGAGASTANVLYSYVNNQTIRFTARAATQYQYKTSGRAGDFYVLVRVADPSDTADTGIWYPIAIKVTSKAPAALSPTANFTLGFNGYAAGTDERDATYGDVESNSLIITPISYVDTSGTVQGIGRTATDISDNGHARPFTYDSDTFMYGATAGSTTEASVVRSRALNDFAMLNTVNGAIFLDVSDEQTGTFFTVETVTLYAARSVFARIPESSWSGLGIRGAGETLVSFNGIKITPLRSTDDKYFQFRVNVKDSHGTTAIIPILVKVENRDVSLRRGSETSYKINALESATNTPPYGSFGMNTGINTDAVNYTIENGDVLQLTPYDFAYDFDLDRDNSQINPTVNGNTTYNSNPVNGELFATLVRNCILKSYNIAVTSVPNVAAAVPSGGVLAQTLNFANREGIVAGAAQYASYITVTVENECAVGNNRYNVPCVRITGLSRTTSAIVQLRIGVTDGFSTVERLITIAVRNSAPMLNTEENHPIVDNDRSRVPAYYTMSASGGFDDNGTLLPTTRSFTAAFIAYDKDGDRPTFIANTARIVAKDGNGYYTALLYDGTTYRGVDAGTAGSHALSDYIAAVITKDEYGNDIIRLTALSSTEIFDKPIYLEFGVQDGFRAQLGVATLYLNVGVVNTDPVMYTDGLTKTYEQGSDPERGDDPDEFTWYISYENRAEINLTRYISNSRELSEDPTALVASAANKIWLFDDTDAQQNVQVYPHTPSTDVSAAGLVKRFDNRTNDPATGGKLFNNPITADTFAGSNYQGASVIYTPMYNDGTEDDYISIELQFFTKNAGGGFTPLPGNSQSILTAEYWAIKIVDSHKSGLPSAPMQLAIAVKDNHHGKTLYADPSKTELKSASEQSSMRIVNFFFNYTSPGVTAMHSYYRTNGNAEANTVIDGTGATAVYSVDQRGIVGSYHLSGEDATRFDASTDATARQNILKTAKFKDDFMYQYFVKTTGEGITYKHFEGTATPFTYKPIEVGGDSTGTGTKVPMSYIAMPSTVADSTEGTNTHVTFGNAVVTSGAVSSTQLKDYGNEYMNWGNTEAGKQLIFANLSLTDGSTTWTGATLNNNPYVKISYLTGTGGRSMFDTRYVNTVRGQITSDGSLHTYEGQDYREDKYGFLFERQTNNNVRAPGLLKLTVAVKTVSPTASTNTSKVEYVDVDIKMINAKPSVKYGNQTITGYVTGIPVSMTMGETAGKSVILERAGGTGTAIKMTYTDTETTDTMKFYMPSALGTMTNAEIDYINMPLTTNMSASQGALTSYYNVPDVASITSDIKYSYDPNPDYTDYFDVSPATGASASLQFIPKAKTQLRLPSDWSDAQINEYLAEHHLGRDVNGKIYYPFRVLFYDECNGTPFTEGYWGGAVFYVYIDNDAISVNTDTVTDSYTLDGRSEAMYKFNLSKNTSFFVDVSSLLTDNDIVLNGFNSFSTATDSSWTGLTAAEQYQKDYFVMPETYTRINYAGSELPIDVSYGNGTAQAKTTIIFEATCAFKNDVYLYYTFADSNGSQVRIVFCIGYNNDAPTANAETFGGADTIEITMKKGDTFDLYAVDSTTFAGDANGGFNSYSLFYPTGRARVTFPLGGTEMTAAQMKENFQFYTAADYPTDRPADGINLGSLVLASDDAPTTMRIMEWGFAVQDDASFFTVSEPGIRYRLENESQISRPMALRITALGAISTTFTVTLRDGSGNLTETQGKAVTVNIRLTVLSTPPSAKTTGLPNGMTYITGETNTYAVSLSLDGGMTKRFAIGTLNGFMTDVDQGDVSTLSVYTNVDGTQFSINNPDNSPVVTASYEVVSTVGYVVLTATDFINRHGDVATVEFRVVDRNGAVSDVIKIKVSIDPSSVTSLIPQNRSYAVQLMGYDEFSDFDGNANQAQSVQIIHAGSDAVIFKDPDVDAPSAGYNVSVYALIKKVGTDDNVTFQSCNLNDRDYDKGSALLYNVTRDGLSGPIRTNPGVGDIYDYVRRFFSLTVSGDGKTIMFVPNAATIATRPDVEAIMLYVEVAKRYEHISNSAPVYTMQEQAATLAVSVRNSRVVAVENSPYNSGYPLVGSGENVSIRESDFLEFRGTAGDSLTWNLYDKDNYELGLFYDWDMLNDPDGRETISYLGYDASNPEQSISGNRGDVLSVSLTGAGSSQRVTIKINRKVYSGQPGPEGLPNAYTAITVTIYAVDTINKGLNPSKTDAEKVCANRITVYVENDVPEISRTVLAGRCPNCGATSGINQYAANMARCSTCSNTFKSLDPDRLGYSITYSEVDGYVMEAALENTRSLSVNIADIIDDADIAMDQYVLLYTGDSDSLVGSDGVAKQTLTSSDGLSRLFRVETTTASNSYGISSLSRITFTCVSNARGNVAVAKLQFRDSVATAKTSILTLRLTVDNIAPTRKEGVSTSLILMGAGASADAATVAARSKTYSILDFISDANGDAFDAKLPANEGKWTYAFIDEIVVYMSDDEVNAPEIYGPNLKQVGEDGEEYNTVDTVCNVLWQENDDKHQNFTIEPFAGIYGVQKVMMTIIDSGYMDGADAGVSDGKSFRLTFTITIANPLDDVADRLPQKEMVQGVTRTVTVTDLLGVDNAKGYTISAMQEVSGHGYVNIVAPGTTGAQTSAAGDSTEWRINAITEGVDTDIKVTFSAGGLTVDRILPIRIVANNAPQYKNNTTSYNYTTLGLLDRSLRTLKIYPEDWLVDGDAEDVMRFVSPVVSSQSVAVEAELAMDDNGRTYILLKFNRRGESEITVTVQDLSGRNYTRKIIVNCTDAPEQSWWESFLSLIEANMMWFWVIVAGVVVFLILLIVLIVVVSRKRKMRREIEALLESETELEEEMMRLSAGTVAQYQSFGYLPPTQQTVADPGLMLGGGAGAPAPNSLQLNAGTGGPQQGVQQPQQMQQQGGYYNQGATYNTIPGSQPQRPPQQPMQQRPPQQQQPMTPPPANNDGFNPDDF